MIRPIPDLLSERGTYPFDKLLLSVAMGNRDEDTLLSLAGRLARVDRELNDKDSKEIEQAFVNTGLKPAPTMKQAINNLLDAVDPDKQIEKAKEVFGRGVLQYAPTEDEIKKAGEELVKEACKPFDSPELRNTIIEIKRRNEQIIDNVSKDIANFAGFDAHAKEKARTVVDTFKKFIEENKDGLTALQIIYSKPYGRRHLTYEEIKQLAESIKKPPYYLTTEQVWYAYEQLEKSKVRGAGPQKLLTNIVSLIRFAIGRSDTLEPFPETVAHRFDSWLAEQEKDSKRFTPEQKEWLMIIKDHIATSLSISTEDFEYAPFYEKGGSMKFNKVFGKDANKIISELNEVLVA